MGYLIIVSIIWGFSFGIIKVGFSGLAPELLSTLRLLIATVFFIPFLRFNFRKSPAEFRDWFVLGAVQYGIMYLCLFYSFQYLAAYEVALMTVFTPLFIIIFDRIQSGKSTLRAWIAAGIAVVGTLIIKGNPSWPDRLTGIALMQIANAAFAFGQIRFRTLSKKHHSKKPVSIYAIIFAGATATCLFPTLFTGNLPQIATISQNQWLALIYLGAIASGLCFFGWNIGATKVSSATLAVFNNLKIPIAILISITIFKESAHWPTLLVGCSLLGLALYIAEDK